MKNLCLIALFSFLTLTNGRTQTEMVSGGEYTLVIEGFDWGAAVSKIILSLDEVISTVDKENYLVQVRWTSDCAKLYGKQAEGTIPVLNAYVSDEKGNRAEKGQFITLLTLASPFDEINSPIKYITGGKCNGGNHWVNYYMTISNKKTYEVWIKEKKRIIPLVDEFDLEGRYRYNDNLTFNYASFSPKTEAEKNPLIIWLHGGGEGGTDPTIPLLANRAANYASSEIQTFFGGAYVLVPQCPGAWMHNEAGVSTWGKENDIYNQGLMALIKDYVAKNPKIDEDRIYLGGCSNGGYMTIKLMLLYPDYFAAGFPSALAYHSQYLSDKQIKSIKHLPIWFIHSKDDTTTPPDETVVPIYKRLIAAGAKKVHFSYFDHVTDITGLFGGEQHHYYGHLSWIYSHANKCQLDYDGSPVMLEGKPVTLMGWLAAQRRAK